MEELSGICIDFRQSSCMSSITQLVPLCPILSISQYLSVSIAQGHCYCPYLPPLLYPLIQTTQVVKELGDFHSVSLSLSLLIIVNTGGSKVRKLSLSHTHSLSLLVSIFSLSSQIDILFIVAFYHTRFLHRSTNTHASL